NAPPTESSIANKTVQDGSGTVESLAFTVSDLETAAGSLTVTATSSNTSLLPASGITLGGSGANRTISLAPVVGQIGTSTITLTVTDAGGLTATKTFTLTVNNAPPTETSIGNQSVQDGSGN